MCAYDTTVVETIDPTASQGALPVCLRRDNLSSIYFPKTSRATLLAFFVVSLVYFLASRSTISADVWHRLEVGRWTAAHGESPTGADLVLGSITAAPTQTVMPIVGQSTISRFGAEGILLLHAILVTAACVITLLVLRASRVNETWAAIGAFAAFALASQQLTPMRPNIIGFALLPLVLWAVVRLRYYSAPVCWLPLLFVLWANADPSFFVGITVLLVGLIGNVWERRSVSSWNEALRHRSTRRFTLALLVTSAACGANSVGFAIYPIAIQQFVVGSYFNELVWNPPLAIGSLAGLIFYASLFTAVVILKLCPHRVTLTDVFLFSLAAVATFCTGQFLTPFAIVWAWIVMPHAQAVWNRFQKSKPVVRDQSPRDASMRSLVAVTLVFTALMLAPPSRAIIAGEREGMDQLVNESGPIYVAQTLKERALQGRFYAPASWSDYISWVNQGNLKPLLGCQVRSNSAAAVTAYRAITKAEGGWLKAVRDWQINFLVIGKNQKQLRAAVVSEDRSGKGRLRITYQDQQCLLAEILSFE